MKVLYWVLRSGDCWYSEMGPIGPRMVSKKEMAAKFKTKRDAMKSDAYSFPLLDMQPEAVTVRDRR